MPISATGPKTTNSRRRERGLTLVELLVGLAIAGLAASAVLLTLPPAPSSLAGEAERLARHLRAAAGLAVVSGRAIGVEVTQEGYRFYRREADGWQPLRPGAALDAARWSSSVNIDLRRTETVFAASDSPQIQPPAPILRFEPIALATPFTLRLARQGERVRIRGDMAGKISLEDGDA